MIFSYPQTKGRFHHISVRFMCQYRRDKKTRKRVLSSVFRHIPFGRRFKRYVACKIAPERRPSARRRRRDLLRAPAFAGTQTSPCRPRWKGKGQRAKDGARMPAHPATYFCTCFARQKFSADAFGANRNRRPGARAKGQRRFFLDVILVYWYIIGCIMPGQNVKSELVKSLMYW